MPSRPAPGLGLAFDWDLGEDAWKDGMDANLRTVSVLLGGNVLSVVAATPGAPAQGDRHIFSAAHPTQANKIAIYDEAAWVYLTPVEGVILYNLADDKRYEFVDGAWAEFVPSTPALVVENQAGAAYSLVAGDAGKLKRFTTLNAVITVPAGVFGVGDRVRMTDAVGGVTLTPAATVTLNSRGGALTSAGQYAGFEIVCVAANTFDVIGDLIV